jgi:hypothetical protein
MGYLFCVGWRLRKIQDEWQIQRFWALSLAFH